MAKGKQKVRFDELQLQRLDEESSKRKKRNLDTAEDEDYELEDEIMQGEPDGLSRRKHGNSEEIDENEAKGRQARELKKQKVFGAGGLGIADDDDFGHATEKTGWAEFENAEEDYDEPEVEFNENGVKFEPFHLKQERKDGYFDEDGNYVENRMDNDVHDAWLDSAEVMDEKAVLKLKILEEKAISTKKNDEDLSILDISRMKQDLVQLMQPSENIIKALKRLGETGASGRHAQLKGPHGKRKMSPEVMEAFERMTELANTLLDAGEHNIYSDSREELLRDISAFRSSSAAQKVAVSLDDAEDMFGDDEDENKAEENQEIPDSMATENRPNVPSNPNPARPAQDTATESEDGNPPETSEIRQPPGISHSDTHRDFILDSTSGYYFSSSRNMYYDPTSGLYGSPFDRKWYHCENGQYIEVPTEKSDRIKPLEDMSTRELLAFLKAKNVDVSNVVEKGDLLNIARKMSTV